MKTRIFVICSLMLLVLMTGCTAPKVTEAPASTEAAASTEVTTEAVTEGQTGIDPNSPHPTVTLVMEAGGEMTLELYPEIAPNTVNNFISLAQKGYYNGLIFHRVIEGFMIQGGDPTGTGMGGPGYGIIGEFASNKIDNPVKHQRGVISMARSKSYDSAGSQFFIMHQDTDQLDGDYAAFGMMTEGLDVLDALATVKTNAEDRPMEDLKIKEVLVTLNGYDFKEPEVIK